MQNVVTIKRHEKQPFPDLWPKFNMESVTHLLHRSQPAEVAEAYHFAIKKDFTGSQCSVILQPNNDTVLFQAPPKKALSDPFTQWLAFNTKNLRYLSGLGFTGTIVGKMATVDGIDVFCVYYVIQGGIVYVDAPSIDALLSIHSNLFDGTMVAIPVERIAVLRIDRPNALINTREFNSVALGSMVALPVCYIDPRMSEDGDEVVGPPKLTSTPVHMKFSAFIHTMTTPVIRRQRDDAYINGQ